MRQLESSPIFKAIKGRRSVREFEVTAVEDEVILSVLEAARWAPSGGNLQPLAYVVVTESGLLEKVKAVSPGLLGNPTALIIVCLDNRLVQSTGMTGSYIVAYRIEVGMAAQNILLQAEDLGLGTCAIRSFNAAAVRGLLSIPADLDPELIVSLGYPTRKPEAPPRRSLPDIVHWGSYGAARAD